MKLEKDINLLTPLLKQAVLEICPWYAGLLPGRGIVVGETQRTPQRQLMKFCQGRLPIEAVRILLDEPDAEDIKVTNCDGYNKKSKHNALPLSKGVDLWVMENGKIKWDEAYYKPFGFWVIQNYHGILRWGGEWGDGPHIEEITQEE